MSDDIAGEQRIGSSPAHRRSGRRIARRDATIGECELMKISPPLPCDRSRRSAALRGVQPVSATEQAADNIEVERREQTADMTEANAETRPTRWRRMPNAADWPVRDSRTTTPRRRSRLTAPTQTRQPAATLDNVPRASARRPGRTGRAPPAIGAPLFLSRLRSSAARPRARRAARDSCCATVRRDRVVDRDQRDRFAACRRAGRG